MTLIWLLPRKSIWKISNESSGFPSWLKVLQKLICCVNRKEFKNKKESDWWTPRWFVPSKSPVTGEDDWRATGDFWKEDFSRSPQIFWKHRVQKGQVFCPTIFHEDIPTLVDQLFLVFEVVMKAERIFKEWDWFRFTGPLMFNNVVCTTIPYMGTINNHSLASHQFSHNHTQDGQRLHWKDVSLCESSTQEIIFSISRLYYVLLEIWINVYKYI